jgi:hypothetical protein
MEVFNELSAAAAEENGGTGITTGPACRAWKEFGDAFRAECAAEGIVLEGYETRTVSGRSRHISEPRAPVVTRIASVTLVMAPHPGQGCN